MKKIAHIYYPPDRHWVGNGFQMQTYFRFDDGGEKNIEPFLFLDYNPARHFDGGRKSDFRGVDAMAKRGFETITLTYQGEVAFKDAHGNSGVAEAGDVQWTTLGAGTMHKEFHGENYSKNGGMLELMKIGINLPAKDKATPPKTQLLKSDSIPVAELANDAGSARVIAGELEGVQGAASTFSPINIWDITMNAAKVHLFNVPESHNLVIFVNEGTVLVNGEQVARRGEMLTFEKGGADVEIESNNESKFLMLTGEPLNEPFAAHDEFIMNNDAELLQALRDVMAGNFGKIED